MRTSPEVEAAVLELVKAGKSRREVHEATGVNPRVITRIVRDAPGVEFALNGTGSNGTAESMAKARGVQSKYAANRRAFLSDRILDETERTLDLLAKTTAPRDRQFLSQSLKAQSASYADLTAQDARAAEDFSEKQSQLDLILATAMGISKLIDGDIELRARFEVGSVGQDGRTRKQPLVQE